MPPFQGDPFATVVKEVRDRGLAWKDYAHGVRRGRELVIWAALEAGNYMYIMSYAFHDDGTIAFRVGATGQNLLEPVTRPTFTAPTGGSTSTSSTARKTRPC